MELDETASSICFLWLLHLWVSPKKLKSNERGLSAQGRCKEIYLELDKVNDTPERSPKKAQILHVVTPQMILKYIEKNHSKLQHQRYRFILATSTDKEQNIFVS